MKQRNQDINANNKAQDNSEFYKALNYLETPKKLTIEQLRKYKDYENVSEEEGENIINTLYKLSIIAYSYYRKTN